MSKRRSGFPSETRVKRGRRVVGGDKELVEKPGLPMPHKSRISEPLTGQARAALRRLARAQAIACAPRLALTCPGSSDARFVGHRQSLSQRPVSLWFRSSVSSAAASAADASMAAIAMTIFRE